MSETLKPMLRLAMPVLLEESLNLLVGYTDWWLTGHFLAGAEYKAAMGTLAYLMWLIPSLFSAVAIGATALIARFVGARDLPLASRTAAQALVLGGAWSVVVAGGCFACGPAFLRLLQPDPEAARLGALYLLILAWAIPAIMFEQVASACLRGAGDTVSGLIARIVLNLTNAGLSTVLVIGVGPFPQLGWPGLAIGTAVGHLAGASVLLLLLARGHTGLRLAPQAFRPDASLMRRLLRIGVPGGVDMLTILTCHLTYSAIINRLGVIASAAHGLGVQIEALAYLPGSAFQVAATTITGQALGEGNPARARRSVFFIAATNMAFMTLVAGAFVLVGPTLAAWFTGSPTDPTTQLAARYLALVALSLPALALLQVVSGALRGAGDTTWPLTITLAGLVLLRIGGGVWLAWDEIRVPFTTVVFAGWNLGVEGAWWAMVTDVIVRSLLCSARFMRGAWQRIVV